MDILEDLVEEYRHAKIHFMPQISIDAPVTPNRKWVGMIGTEGKDKRFDLQRHLGLSFKDKTVVFIYLGLHDHSFLPWLKLEEMEDCVFITRDNIETCTGNLFVLDNRFSYADLIASSDLVCTKSGYSTLATAFYAGKPVVTCDRDDFSEVETVRRFLKDHSVGIMIPPDRFNACDWEDPIRKARLLEVKGKVMLNGELEILKYLKSVL